MRRASSPVGGSTLMTSAPISASSRPHKCVRWVLRSRTRSPFSAPAFIGELCASALGGGSARALRIPRPHPRLFGAADSYQHAIECGGMDEQLGHAGFVTRTRRELRAPRLEAFRDRIDVVGLNEKHVQRVAALA